MMQYDYIITGGGLSGLLLAYRMAKDSFFNQKKILIIDAEKKLLNDRTWSFWEKGIGEWDAILESKWNKVKVLGEGYQKETEIKPYVYKTLKSNQFYGYLWKIIKDKKNITFLQETILNITDCTDHALVTTQKKEYKGKQVFNSALLNKNYTQQTKYPVLQQHFVGWFVKTDKDVFEDDKVTFMDFSVKQKNNTRFMYVLPFAKNFALIEYTLFSDTLLPLEEYEKEIKLYLAQKGVDNYQIKETEKGAIPMTCFEFWKENSQTIFHIGTAGGWTKASTGYTFSSTNKKTKDLIGLLKKKKKPVKLKNKNRFWWYDLLFLDVLSSRNGLGATLFIKLFKRNKTSTILRFLEGETHFFQELSIMMSMPSKLFIATIIKRLKG